MRVVLGVTGGIAAYKATTIIRSLTEVGLEVKVIPTENAMRFIGATTLEALSHNTVDHDLYTDVASVKHIELGQSAELVIVAPATASFIARFAAGIADDLLLNTLLATNAPILIAPAMHTEMWQHPSTVANVETLRRRGIKILEPAVGRLTGSDSGPGRLPEPEDIVSAALELVHAQDLVGQVFLVSAGGTQEPIDPVRYIGNRSSGKQGLAIARAAKQRGAKVVLVAANLEESTNEFDTVLDVATAAELASEIDKHLATASVLVMTAAVSDFRVANSSSTKLKRSELGDELELKLVANPDVLRNSVSRIKANNLPVTTVGFAAETAGGSDALLKLGEHKLAAKGCDILVANDVTAGKIFGESENSVIILTRKGASDFARGTKDKIANRILDVLIENFL